MAMFHAPIRKQAGLSLVELLIALTIGLLLLAGLTLIFVNSSEANRELQKTAQQIENGRYAIDLLTQDLRLAGFYGHFHELPAAPAALPDPCEIASTTNLHDALALPVQGYRAGDLATVPDITATTCDDKGLLTDANLKAGSDILVVQRAHTTALVEGTGTAVTNEVYIQAIGTQAEIQLGNGATLGVGKKADGNNTVLKTHTGASAPIRKYHVHVYFVAPCSIGSGANGVCQAGDDSIPTLKRLQLVSEGNVTKMKLVPLVEGIEYFKIEYGIDNASVAFGTAPDPSTGLVGDSTVDAFTATPADWTQVIAAKVYILARNTEPTSGFTDTGTYTLGTVDVPATNDPFRRHVYTAAVRLVNPSGRREPIL